MTQGELEKIPLKIGQIFSDLELRIMTDIVRRIKENGFSTASADWQITRLQQLGKSEQEIKKWIKDALKASDEEMQRIFSDDVYEQYYGHERAYKNAGISQIALEENTVLQQTITAAMQQISGEYQNLAASMGFAIRGADGKIVYSPLMEYYRSTLDNAVMDIHSGAFSYQQVLNRTISQMAASGVRWIDYDSGHHNRIDVAARRAVMTGFRQVQGLINEQVAAELGTDQYEVTYHVGARPSHQPWQGKVWTMQQLRDVCGLGTGPGLHGWNCYHDYNPFLRGAVRTYTDDQLQQMIDAENTPKAYNGKEYTTYEALQQQRKMETAMRATRQKIKLLQEGGAPEKDVILQKAKYQGQMQNYKDFSEKMKLPEQKQRIMQDGLRGRFMPTKTELKNIAKPVESDIIKSGAISGARNPYGKAAEEHAKKYYGLVRSMKTDVQKIAKTTGYSEAEIQRIKNYIFTDEHDLGERGRGRFDPDYMMGESWRRLMEGKPESHDMTMLRHEIMEQDLMEQGFSQDEAHRMTSAKYNYDKEACEFYGKIKKFKKE